MRILQGNITASEIHGHILKGETMPGLGQINTRPRLELRLLIKSQGESKNRVRRCWTDCTFLA